MGGGPKYRRPQARSPEPQTIGRMALRAANAWDGNRDQLAAGQAGARPAPGSSVEMSRARGRRGPAARGTASYRWAAGWLSRAAGAGKRKRAALGACAPAAAARTASRAVAARGPAPTPRSAEGQSNPSTAVRREGEGRPIRGGGAAEQTAAGGGRGNCARKAARQGCAPGGQGGEQGRGAAAQAAHQPRRLGPRRQPARALRRRQTGAGARAANRRKLPLALRPGKGAHRLGAAGGLGGMGQVRACCRRASNGERGCRRGSASHDPASGRRRRQKTVSNTRGRHGRAGPTATGAANRGAGVAIDAAGAGAQWRRTLTASPAGAQPQGKPAGPPRPSPSTTARSGAGTASSSTRVRGDGQVGGKGPLGVQNR